MTTTADLISEAKRHLQSFQREPMNRLGNAATNSDTSLTFEFDTSSITAGSYVQLGLELIYVWSVEPASKTALVQRAQLGSIAAAHSVGAVATINPKFPDFAILKAINDDLADLSAPANGLYAMRSADLTFSVGSSGYDLDGVTDLLEVHEIRYRVGAASSYRQWPVLTNYELSRDVNAVDFPSGFGLFLSEGGAHGQPLRVLYKAGFSPLTTLADDVELVSGLPASMHDIPPMGAAVRMVAPREVKRNFTESQGEPRRASEVPPGAVLSSVRGLASERQRRIANEAGKLAQQYPDRGFIPTSTTGLLRQRGAGRRW